MSKDWTPDELQAASAAMERAGHPSYDEFCAELEKLGNFGRLVRVTLADGNTITTRINGTDEEIRQYYRVGSLLNVGTVYDDMVKIVAVDILADAGK